MRHALVDRANLKYIAAMKRIIIPTAILLLIVTIWSGGYLFFVGQINTNVAEYTNPDNPQFSGLTCEKFQLGGFPFRIDANCINATFVDGDATYKLPKLQLTILIYRPTHALLFAEGPLHYSDAFFGTEQLLRWTSLRTSVRTNGWQLVRASVEAENIEYVDALLGETIIASTPSAEIHLIDLPEKRGSKDEPATLALFAKSTALDVLIANITGAELIAEAEISAIPADLRLWGDPAILRNWQTNGGNIDIQNITGETKDARFSLAGNLSLDDQGAAQGEITLQSTGMVETFGDSLNEEMRTLIFGNPAADGSHSQVVTINGGIVFVGLFPVASLMKLF